MWRPLVIGATVAVVVGVLAGVAASSDIYISGKVVGRVAGSSSSKVQIAWDYKCLGGKLGEATYEWTLQVVRTKPLPQKTTVLGTGTSQRGTKTLVLPPGEYVPRADPFRCETERGAGYDKPEVGSAFAVPDYCAWTVTSTRGAVELEQGTAVRLARPGSTVAPGDALATPAGGKVALTSLAREGTAALDGASRLELDARHCASKGGWRLVLARGAVTAVASPRAGAKGSFETATRAATAAGAKGARWRMELKGKATVVRALQGTVTVRKSKGSPVVLKAGQTATVG